MANALTLIKRHGVGGVTEALIGIVLSGTYATGGEPIVFAAAVGYTNREPDFVSVNSTNGLNYMYDATNDKLKAFGTTYGSETAAGAYPASITGDTITARVTWISTPKLS